ncbi:MAG: hypothetical protein AABW82_03840 [Nanoarchaeota archaeon]
MNKREISHILAAIIILAVISSFGPIFKTGYSEFPKILLFSAIIIGVSIAGKKIVAFLLDSDVEHEIWQFQRFGWKPHYYLPNKLPFGIIIPLFFTIFSLGFLKVCTILTYEARALKYRASRRFGFYSFTELTDWHNAIIGAAGIISVLIIAAVGYLPGIEYLSKMSAFYALTNLIPYSKLDGTQIFFGSRVLYTALLVISLIFFVFALII